MYPAVSAYTAFMTRMPLSSTIIHLYIKLNPKTVLLLGLNQFLSLLPGISFLGIELDFWSAVS